MTIFMCEPIWENILTAMYDAWSSRKGYENIRFMIEPVKQYSLFDEYIRVETDTSKARKVMDAINLRISTEVYRQLVYTSLSYEEDAIDNIYRVMILGFSLGDSVLDMVKYRDVMRNCEIRKRLSGEVHHFREFIRFHQIGEKMYVAHIEPKSRVLSALGDSFSDRMPSENWMIVDDTHKEALVHPVDKDFYIWKLSEDEFARVLRTEEENDQFTDLWKVFFDSIAIKQRKNEKCQNNLFPIWTRKHAVEFVN